MRVLLTLLLVIAIPLSAVAGEVVTTPSPIILSSPTTDQVEKLRMSFFYSATDVRVVIWYNIMSTDGSTILKEESLTIRNVADNPESITANCTGPGEPWALCTGAGTCDNNCDETDNSFNDFVSGFGATLQSRGDTQIWQDIQSKYTVQ